MPAYSEEDSAHGPDVELDRHDREVDIGEDPEKTDIDPTMPLEPGENLAPIYAQTKDGKKFLQELSELVCENFDEAWAAQQPMLDRCKEDIRVFLGDLPRKDAAFENAPNPHTPIMLKTLTRLASRMEGELFGDWRSFAAALPVSMADREIAGMVERHQNWQLANQITDFKRQARRGVLLFFLYGDIVCHTTWDENLKMNRHEMLTPEDYVFPLVRASTMPDLSDVPFRCRILLYSKHELQRKRDEWFDVDRVLDEQSPSWDDEPEQPLTQSAAESSGKDPSETEDAAPYKVIWYEGWIDLPEQPEARWCRVVFEHSSRAIFHVSIHEQDNWQDAQRYNKQTQEVMQYRAAVQAFQSQYTQLEMQVQSLQQAAMMPQVMPEQTQVAQQALQQATMQLQSVQPPQRPAWADEAIDAPDWKPEPIRQEPISLWAHAVCIEPPAGPMGVSFGRIEADYNRTADNALGKFADAASLANSPPMLAKDEVEFEGKPGLAPGKVHKVKNVEGALEDSFRVVPFPPGNSQLVQLAQLCDQWGDEAIQSPSVLSGDPGKSGETARGLGMRVEQAVKQLSSFGRTLAEFFVQVLRNNAKLNAVYLEEEELYAVQDPDTRQLQEHKIGRAVYERNYLYEFKSDMRFESKAQKVGEADEMLRMIGSVPQLGMDIALIRYAIGKCFEARGYKDYAMYLGPQPAPPQTPMGMQPPAPPGMPGAPPGAPGAPVAAPPPHPAMNQPMPAGALPPGTSPAPRPPGQPSPPAPRPPGPTS